MAILIIHHQLRAGSTYPSEPTRTKNISNKLIITDEESTASCWLDVFVSGRPSATPGATGARPAFTPEPMANEPQQEFWGTELAADFVGILQHFETKLL